jgi:hypothetical protein
MLDVAAKNDAARSVVNQDTIINGQDPNASPDQAAAQAEAKKVGATLVNHQTAANQGAIDPGSAQARMLACYSSAVCQASRSRSCHLQLS